jgi:hypothetical protein
VSATGSAIGVGTNAGSVTISGSTIPGGQWVRQRWFIASFGAKRCTDHQLLYTPRGDRRNRPSHRARRNRDR